MTHLEQKKTFLDQSEILTLLIDSTLFENQQILELQV